MAISRSIFNLGGLNKQDYYYSEPSGEWIEYDQEGNVISQDHHEPNEWLVRMRLEDGELRE